eukprot:gene7176-7982_t
MNEVRWAFNIASWRPTKEEWLSASACISLEEKTRVHQFVFKNDAKLALVGRLLIRSCINEILGIPWQDIVLKRSEKSKPYLVGCDQAISFNISHQGNYSIIAASKEHQVGVDVMKIDKPANTTIPDFFNTMRRQFTPEEWQIMKSKPGEWHQMASFYRFWCLKESYVKAVGSGLGTSTAEYMRFELNTENLSKKNVVTNSKLFIQGEKVDWVFHESLLDDHHVATVAIMKDKNNCSEIRAIPFQLKNLEYISKQAVHLQKPDPEDWMVTAIFMLIHVSTLFVLTEQTAIPPQHTDEGGEDEGFENAAYQQEAEKLAQIEKILNVKLMERELPGLLSECFEEFIRSAEFVEYEKGSGDVIDANVLKNMTSYIRFEKCCWETLAGYQDKVAAYISQKVGGNPPTNIAYGQELAKNEDSKGEMSAQEFETERKVEDTLLTRYAKEDQAMRRFGRNFKDPRMSRFGRNADEDQVRRFARSADEDQGRRFGRNADEDQGRRFGRNVKDPMMSRFGRSAAEDEGRRFGRNADEDQGRRFGRNVKDPRMSRFGRSAAEDEGRRFGRNADEDQGRRFGRNVKDPRMSRFGRSAAEDEGRRFGRNADEDQGRRFGRNVKDPRMSRFGRSAAEDEGRRFGRNADEDQGRRFGRNVKDPRMSRFGRSAAEDEGRRFGRNADEDQGRRFGRNVKDPRMSRFGRSAAEDEGRRYGRNADEDQGRRFGRNVKDPRMSRFGRSAAEDEGRRFGRNADEDQGRRFGRNVKDPRMSRFGRSAAEDEGRRFGRNADDDQGRRFGRNAAEVQGRRFGRNAAEVQGRRFGRNAAEVQGRRFGRNADEVQGRRFGRNADESQGRRFGRNVKGPHVRRLGRNLDESQAMRRFGRYAQQGSSNGRFGRNSENSALASKGKLRISEKNAKVHFLFKSSRWPLAKGSTLARLLIKWDPLNDDVFTIDGVVKY